MGLGGLVDERASNMAIFGIYMLDFWGVIGRCQIDIRVVVAVVVSFNLNLSNQHLSDDSFNKPITWTKKYAVKNLS